MSRTRERGPSLTKALWADAREHSIPAWAGAAIGLLIAAQTAVRGLDMWHAPQSQSPVNAVVDLVGVEAYALAFILAGLIQLVCILTHRAGVVAAGHVLTAAVYLGYSISVIQGVMEAGYGWRFVTFGLTGASLVLALVYVKIARDAFTKRIIAGDIK